MILQQMKPLRNSRQTRSMPVLCPNVLQGRFIFCKENPIVYAFAVFQESEKYRELILAHVLNSYTYMCI